MSIDDINDPKAVRKAIAEFRTIGQARFLKKYGFGASRGWMLRDEDGQEFDAKAVLGAAHGFQYPSLGHLPQNRFGSVKNLGQAACLSRSDRPG